MVASVIAVSRSTVPKILKNQTNGLDRTEPRNTSEIATRTSADVNRSPNAAGYANCGGKPGKVATRVRNIIPRCRVECKGSIGTRICWGRTRVSKGSKYSRTAT